MIELVTGQRPEEEPISAEAVKHFGADARLVAAGTTVLGFQKLAAEPGKLRQQFCWFDGGFVESDLIVGFVSSDPSIHPGTGDALVADSSSGSLFAVDLDGASTLLGTLPTSYSLEDFRAASDGTLLLNCWSRTQQRSQLCFYSANGKPLGRAVMKTPAMLIEMAVFDGPVQGSFVALASDGNELLEIIGVRRQGDTVEVRKLAQFTELCACSMLQFLDDYQRARWPSKAYHFCESGVGAMITGVDEAFEEFDSFPEMRIVKAPPLR